VKVSEYCPYKTLEIKSKSDEKRETNNTEEENIELIQAR
jgi:hypothetical protein